MTDHRAAASSPRGSTAPAATIVHMTSHHDIHDNRIFHRECRSLVAAGYTVVLVAQHDRDEHYDGVRILGVPRYRNRLERVTLTAARVTWRALGTRATVYHFHDPELVPFALLLRLLGKQVVYDVHEDFVQAVAVRPWLPAMLRPLLSFAVRGINRLARAAFSIVVAERYYRRSFPGATEVLNYVEFEKYAAISKTSHHPPPARIRLLYTGSITESRGALNYLNLLDYLPDNAELHIIGQCNVDKTRNQLQDRAASDQRLRVTISAEWIPYTRICEAYEQRWLAGLAIFPNSEHYREKELTKFFEYMAAGLPIICSDFPAWRAVVAAHAVGICVDPDDPAAAGAAVSWLAAHPREAHAMGERGRHLVETRFNWASQADNLIAHYRHLGVYPNVALQ